MSWKINYNLENKIIELSYNDIVTPGELQQAFEETMKMVNQYGSFLILADCRELKGGHTLFDLLELIEQIKVIDDKIFLKEAVILPLEKMPVSKVEFWETACLNRGIKVKLFAESQIAINWLKI